MSDAHLRSVSSAGRVRARRSWSRSAAIAVALGGASGAGMRFVVLHHTEGPAAFPWPVFALNVIGSFLLGVVMADEWRHPKRRTLLHDGVGIGFCGGLTTFSTLAVEVATRLRAGHAVDGFVYLSASITAAVIAALLGAALLHRVLALGEPLEERP